MLVVSGPGQRPEPPLAERRRHVGDRHLVRRFLAFLDREARRRHGHGVARRWVDRNRVGSPAALLSHAGHGPGDGLAARQRANADRRVVQVAGVGRDAYRIQERAGADGIREHLGEGVAQEPEIVEEPSVVDQARLEGRTLVYRLAWVDVAGPEIERIGHAHPVVVTHVLISGGHDGRLGHRRAPVGMRLLDQGEHARHVRTRHRRSGDRPKELTWEAAGVRRR